MKILELYQRVAQAIKAKDFDGLHNLQPVKPKHFNWVTDIFEPLNVLEHPNDKALIWKYNDQQEDFTFAEISARCNQFLNLMRKHGIEKGDKMFIQLPLLAPNWYSYLAGIKGGVVIIPAATSLEVRDLEFRFKSVLPQVALADSANAGKIDEAEKNIGQTIKLKIITEGQRAGWISIDNKIGRASCRERV